MRVAQHWHRRCEAAAISQAVNCAEPYPQQAHVSGPLFPGNRMMIRGPGLPPAGWRVSPPRASQCRHVSECRMRARRARKRHASVSNSHAQQTQAPYDYLVARSLLPPEELLLGSGALNGGKHLARRNGSLLQGQQVSRQALGVDRETGALLLAVLSEARLGLGGRCGGSIAWWLLLLACCC